MEQEVKYYRIIGGNSLAYKINHIYPDTYKASGFISVKESANIYPELWQEVSEETYKYWAKEMAMQLFPAGTRFKDSKDTIRTVLDSDHLIGKNYITCASTPENEWNDAGSNPVLYNLKTCEWAEIVSKPKEEEEIIISTEGGKKAKRIVLDKSLIKSLSEIPEARKLLENSGVIERDYVREVFCDMDGEEMLRKILRDAVKEPYCKISTKDICRYIVEGLERDDKINQ